MNKTEKSKFVSLAVKNAAFYIGLIVVTSLLIGFFIYRLSYSIVLQSSEQNAKHTLDILDVKVQSYLSNIRKDVLFISRSPYLKDYIQAQNTSFEESKRQNLAADYITFLASKPDYAQLRFIGQANNGREIIRVDRMNLNISITGQQQLQEKGTSSYFKETIESPEDSVSFSIIDLNKEYGNLSYPIMPTLRVSCPIWFKQKVYGIAVINANLSSLFNELNTIVKDEYDFFLVNSSGHSLINPDTTKSFSFEFNRPDSFFKELKIDLHAQSSNSFNQIVNDDKYYLKIMTYPRKNYELILCVKSKGNKLLASFYNWRWSILGITLMVSSLMMLLALWWLNKQAKSMNDIVSSMYEFEKDLKTKSLPIERNDEIGIIARSFESLATTIKSNITSLAIAKQEAEAANKQKEEFLQNMSHEIRNPLHTILGMTRMLEDNSPNKEQIPIIESLKFSSTALLSLVNDVLDFSKLKEGRISLNPKNVVLSELVQSIIRSYAFEASAKKIVLQTDIDNKLLGTKFFFDGLRITQVLNNLLSNAIKFSPANTTVLLKILILKEENESISLEFNIDDQGFGIPTEKFEFILQRFQRLENDTKNLEISGSGLGLPIVVQILKLFNSKLELRKKQEQGSVFYFSLIFPKVEMQAVLTEEKNTIVKWNSVLVIDDDPQITMLYKHIFSKEEVDLEIINSIEELIQLENNKKFDVLLTDNYINNDSIISHLDKLNSFLKPGGIKVLVTGNYNLASIISLSDNYFDSVLQKPLQPDRLLELMNKIWLWKSVKLVNLNSLYLDYDFNKEKISNALELLLSEWKVAKIKIEESILAKDQKAKDAVVHRLANSLRRFELGDLELFWRDLKVELPPSNIEEYKQSIIQLQYCIEYIELQLLTWNS
ncbi:MAG: histidine kinase dimerization/phospho-acceptor domain-containing protein [Saprospiraceae bacterium]